MPAQILYNINDSTTVYTTLAILSVENGLRHRSNLTSTTRQPASWSPEWLNPVNKKPKRRLKLPARLSLPGETPAKQRAEILQRWYLLIMEHQQSLAELMVSEQGKPLKEALVEVAYAASFIQWFSEQAKRANGEIIPSAKEGARILATREPIGVVAAITPWNFPLAMLTRKLGPALAAGCTGLIKPANNTPLSAFALLALAEQAGVPAGVLNGVVGDTHAISDAIMASSDVRKISFTGSTNVGKTLMRNAAATMKRISMELGGNAPYIVFDDADLEAAVAGAMACKFRNAGQVCVCVNRFYIQDAIYDEFVNRLAAEVKKLKVGNGMDKDVNMGPLINLAGLEKVEEHVKDALEKGGRLLAGGIAMRWAVISSSQR